MSNDRNDDADGWSSGLPEPAVPAGSASGAVTSGLKDRLIAKSRRVAWRLSYQDGPRLMSALRKRWQVFRNPNATIRFGSNVFAGPGFKVQAPWGGTLIVGDGVEFRRNTLFELWGPETRVSIGNGCYFTYDVIIACATTIDIGERVGLAKNTFVVDGSHRFRDLTKPFLDQG